MKKFFKFIFGVIGTVYLLFAIFITACLLFYNQYKVTEFGDKTFIIIDDKSDEYTNGDLVIFTKNANDDIKSGDKIFFYEVTNGKAKVNSGNVTKSEKITNTETTFTINDVHPISSEAVIGKTETAKVVHKLGKVLALFESQFGFLILIILPSMLLFFYAIYNFVKELKTPAPEVAPATQQPVQNPNFVNITPDVNNNQNATVNPANGVSTAQASVNVAPTQSTTEPVNQAPVTGQVNPAPATEPVNQAVNNIQPNMTLNDSINSIPINNQTPVTPETQTPQDQTGKNSVT